MAEKSSMWKWLWIGIAIVVILAVVLVCVFTIPKSEEVPNDPVIEEPVDDPTDEEPSDEEDERTYEGETTVDGITYSVENGEATLISIEGYEIFEDGEVVIPSYITIEGVDYPVTSIASGTADEPIFSSDEITKVTIPSTITSIGGYVFYYCDNLTKIYFEGELEDWLSIDFEDRWNYSSADRTLYTLYLEGKALTDLIIPEGVETISQQTFNGCDIQSVTFPSTLKEIGKSAFGSCANITEVDLSDTQVTVIDDYAFVYCYGIEQVILPSTLNKIGEHTFDYCTNLISISTIPAGVTEIGRYAFRKCAFETFTFAEGIQLTIIGDGLFNSCANLISIIIPEGVTEIGSWMFNACTSLTSITIPSSVAEIGTGAFNACTELAEVTIESASVYQNLATSNSCGYLIRYATTIKVLESVVDEVGGNEFLSSNYTSELVDGYYVYTAV